MGNSHIFLKKAKTWSLRETGEMCTSVLSKERQSGAHYEKRVCSCTAGVGVLTVPGSLSVPEVTKKRTDMPVQTQRQEQK